MYSRGDFLWKKVTPSQIVSWSWGVYTGLFFNSVCSRSCYRSFYVIHQARPSCAKHTRFRAHSSFLSISVHDQHEMWTGPKLFIFFPGSWITVLQRVVTRVVSMTTTSSKICQQSFLLWWKRSEKIIELWTRTLGWNQSRGLRKVYVFSVLSTFVHHI